MHELKVAIDDLVIGQIPAGTIRNSHLATDIKVGSLALLTTTVKDNLVNAINELVSGLSDANTNIGTKADQKKTWTTTLDTTWSGAGPYTKTVSLEGMLATYVPVIDVIYSSTNSTAISEKEEFSKISKIESGAGEITLTCFEEAPNISLEVRIEVVF